jgi:hypothetical protein
LATWHDVGAGHIVQAIPTDQPGIVTVLWEHDTVQPYPVARHMISSKAGATWRITEDAGRISLSPSVHCDRELGGCGMHGFVTDGVYR